MTKPELLSPTQDFTTLQAAIDAGADAVFFGVVGYNMRVSAKNFSVEDLPKLVKVAHDNDVKAYLALNTIIYDEELDGMEEVLRRAHDAGVDAVICWDLGVVQKAKSIGLEVHLSTQASVANAEAALFYKSLGITRVVLARECTLEQISAIRKKAAVEIETFIHGAMCISISGRCFLSQFSTCHSANRGACLQPCRRNYIIKDTEGQFEFEVGPNYILSPQDLCTLPFLEQLMSAGIDCFKIEGRNKGPEYVHDVTSVYRKAIDFIWEHRDTLTEDSVLKELHELKDVLMPKLERVFNRGFSSGFYLGKPLNAWSKKSDSAALEKKVHVGKVTNYYDKVGVMEVAIQAQEALTMGDEVFVQGETTGHIRMKIESMEIDHKKVHHAQQGETVAIACKTKVRTNDVVSVVRTAGTDDGRHLR